MIDNNHYLYLQLVEENSKKCLKMSQARRKSNGKRQDQEKPTGENQLGNWFSNHCFKNSLHFSFWYGLKLQWHIGLPKTSVVGVQCFKAYLSQNWSPLVLLTHCFLFEHLSNTVSFAFAGPPFISTSLSLVSSLEQSPFFSPLNTGCSFLSTVACLSSPALLLSCLFSLCVLEMSLVSIFSLGSMELLRAKSSTSSCGLSVRNVAKLLWTREALVFSEFFSLSLLTFSFSEEGWFFWEDLSKSHKIF